MICISEFLDHYPNEQKSDIDHTKMILLYINAKLLNNFTAK